MLILAVLALISSTSLIPDPSYLEDLAERVCSDEELSEIVGGDDPACTSEVYQHFVEEWERFEKAEDQKCWYLGLDYVECILTYTPPCSLTRKNFLHLCE